MKKLAEDLAELIYMIWKSDVIAAQLRNGRYKPPANVLGFTDISC